MSDKSASSKMVATKSKNKVVQCSTPERRPESPASDSLCDSDAASPVPFLCTQDGAEGETDVIWNFYTPNSKNVASSRQKNSTPVSRKARKSIKPKVTEKIIPKRRALLATQQKTELFQNLLELNQNLHELIAKKSKNVVSETQQSGSEEDIFNNSGECSPKSGLRTNSRCLRRNVLSSKFGKTETDTALESDDSMNECLIKASQIVEEKILNEPTPAKRTCYENNTKTTMRLKPGLNFNMDQDSMDAILNSIKLESPVVSKAKKYESPKLNNDSFDSLFGNLNDSALERLTQIPLKLPQQNVSKDTSWTVQDIVVHDGSPSSKSFFGRHNSMPESPTVSNVNKPSTSGMAFGRYNSMPYENNNSKELVPGDSPIRCTPEEIKKKHQQAREKLLAKRLLPFTSSQQISQSLVPLVPAPPAKKTQFKPRVATTAVSKTNIPANNEYQQKLVTDPVDLKLLIEKKRQEALMKLRRRQPQK